MNDCCSSSVSETTRPNKHKCPGNGKEYSSVSAKTIAHHIGKAWEWTPTVARYFFCDDPECKVVYFGADDSKIFTSQLRSRVGAKEGPSEGPLCYCFGVSKEDLLRQPSIKDFVIAQTKAGLCSCETSNPSGRCCLKDF
jgi:Zinc binding domain